jgi:hypothetical protein
VRALFVERAAAMTHVASREPKLPVKAAILASSAERGGIASRMERVYAPCAFIHAIVDGSSAYM